MEQPSNVFEMVDLGIIIALEEEFGELFDLLEQESEVNTTEDLATTYYTFERHVLASHAPYKCVAMFVGSMGSTRAAVAAERLIATFHPRAVAMLGIAGSLDDEKARAGDVVVATDVDEYLASAKAVSKGKTE